MSRTVRKVHATDTNVDTPVDTTSDLLWSDRVTRNIHAAYMSALDTSPTLGSNIVFKTSKERPYSALEPVSRVFNTQELLAKILLDVSPGHLVTEAQLTCRGFKNSIESCPKIRRRITTALHVSGPEEEYIWSVAPSCMTFHHLLDQRFVSMLEFMKLSFEGRRAIESFRNLLITDKMPHKVDIIWHDRDGVDRSTQPNRLVALEALEGEEGITFGKMFDAVAKAATEGCNISRLCLSVWRLWWPGQKIEECWMLLGRSQWQCRPLTAPKGARRNGLGAA